MNDLNIFAIQKNNEVIIEVLKNIKPRTKDVLIFNNCISKLKLASREIPLYFDKMLYSRENNLLVLVMQDSLVSFDDIKILLGEKNIRFREYNCQKEKDNYNNDNLKEFYFVSSKDTLEKTIKDSKVNGQDSCTYYPNVSGSLEIAYLDELKNKECLKRIVFDRVIELDDKLILIVNQKIKNIDEKEIYASIAKIPLKMVIDIDVNISSLEIEKKEKEKLKRIG